jgi:hypothetical protein
MSVWYRNVPWATGDYWRTDISANTLCSTTIVAARFALKDGPIVQVPMVDLRTALEHAPTRREGTIVGPYNIYPFKSVIEVLQRSTKVRMEFGPYHDLDLDRLTTYHGSKVVPAGHSRPHVPQDYFGFADIIFDKIRSGESTFERVKERLEDLNPTLTVRTRPDGSISRDELAYCIRVNYLRAIRNSHEELLQ